MRDRVASGLCALLLVACSSEDGAGTPGPVPGEGGFAGVGGQGAVAGSGGVGATTGGAAGAGGSTEPGPTSCDFGYDAEFTYPAGMRRSVPSDSHAETPGRSTAEREGDAPVGAARDGMIAHAEPPPPYLWQLPRPVGGAGPSPYVPPESLVLPGYDDTMPLFERATAWAVPERCYETPDGVKLLTESEAYDLYRAIAELTTGVTLDDTPEHRSVVGLRGGYPGRMLWHDNKADRFNDTLVLLWTEGDGSKHVREWPVNTDTGDRDFGPDSSSSLRPNRRYFYVNGWHNDYNALHIDEIDYRVRDDHNTNGHWDSDRNGWLPPLGSDDHDRTGGGHNIHMGSVDAPLGSAVVGGWSAGCQVIPGMANWIEFITNAWTEEGDAVEYFLIDVRDIAPDVWEPCTPDGSHRCPWRIDSLPFSDSRNTATDGEASFDLYNCSAADEGGPEIVYLLLLDQSGTLTVDVDCAAPVDIDVHLLDGDDANACLARDDTSLSWDITPGRYLIVADSYVAGGEPLAGAYTITVDLQ